MVSTRSRGRGGGRGKSDENEVEMMGGNKAEYEESRAQRIKENMERMKSLGILDLSKQLKPKPKPKPKPTPTPTLPPSTDPPRRSSRQKTLGQHTDCSKCKMVTGQFCGDCLYMRYGENVTEVCQNPDWVCPVCRGICNCSRCRRDKGWEPTGAIYKKVVRLGFKSVAHYLIYTYREKASTGVAIVESPFSADGSLPVDEGKEGSSDALPQLGAEKNETAEDNLNLDSDEEYRGDDYEEEEEEEDDGSQ